MTTTGPGPTPHTADPVVLTGYLLRCHLVLALHESGGVLTVADLVAGLDGDGCVTRGRASKDVSDALRWEVARGRVWRLGRGHYVVGALARQTTWRMRRRLNSHLAQPSG